MTVVKWNGTFSRDSVMSKMKEINNILQMSVLFQSPRKYFVETNFNISSSPLTQADIVFYWAASSYAPMRIACENYVQLKHLFYSSLRPVPRLRQYVRDIGKKLGLSRVLFADENRDGYDYVTGPIVGLHFRAHEKEFDWAVVPPNLDYSDITEEVNATTESSTIKSAMNFEKSTPIEVVIESVSGIIAHVPDVKFFVASNSNQIKEQLLKQFTADRIMTLISPEGAAATRNNVAGIQMAVLELYLLGKISDLIMHSKGSSFAAEASYFGPIPVVDMTTVHSYDRSNIPLNIYKNDVKLKFCGLDDHYNAAMDDLDEMTWSKVCYNDDMVDSGEKSRILCTAVQRVKRCDWVWSRWGIPNVFCSSLRGDDDGVLKLGNNCEASDFNFEQLGEKVTPSNVCILTDSRGY